MIGLGLLWLTFGVHISLTVFFLIGARRFLQKQALQPCPAPFSQVIPAFNEAANVDTIAGNIADTRRLGQGVALVDDGSTDGSAHCLKNLSKVYGATFVMMPSNRGKAAALNAGIALASADVVLTLDADTTSSAAAAEGLAGHVSGGQAAIALRMVPAPPVTGLVALQRAEFAYVQSFERVALAGYGVFVTVPGAASLWRREAVLATGGFSDRTLSEDTDMTLTLQARGRTVVLAQEHVATTGCPRSFRALVRQRARWTWGNLQAGLIHGQAALAKSSQVIDRRPGLVMALLCTIKLAGFGIVTLSGIRLVLGELGLADLAAATAIFGSTVVRFSFTRAMISPDSPPALRAVVEVALVQLVNLYAFWWGLLRGMPWSRKW